MNKTIFNFGVGMIVLLYGYTGITKLLMWRIFEFQLRLSPFPLISELSLVIAIGLPILELIVSVLLIAKSVRIKITYIKTTLSFWSIHVHPASTNFDLPLILRKYFNILDTTRIGLVTSGLLLTVFTVYLAALVTAQVHLPCTCGGVLSMMSWKSHLIFNCIYLGLNITLVKFYNRPAISNELNYS